MYICPECRSLYTHRSDHCERDQEPLISVPANRDVRTYPLIDQELDGRYRLIGGLGQGGVGTVYLANHIHLDQLSAVKFLDVDLLGEVDEEQREESLQDFVKEAKLAMMLRHERVVRVMDYGVHDRCPFLVMEYVPGPSLLKRMNSKVRFSVEQCVHMIERVADALSAFHDRRLVHRDLKPANVILDPRDNGELTLVDLGLVKDLSSEARSSTHPLALRGTPGYLAPEQVPSWVLSSAGVDVTSEKQLVDARVDIYALGVLAFELLTGTSPYPRGLSPIKVIVHACTHPPPQLDSLVPEIKEHEGLSELVLSMMARDPRERPLNARAVLDALEMIQEGVQNKRDPLRAQVEAASQALVSYAKSPQGALIPSPSHMAQRAQEASHAPRTSMSEGLIPAPPSLLPPRAHQESAPQPAPRSAPQSAVSRDHHHDDILMTLGGDDEVDSFEQTVDNQVFDMAFEEPVVAQPQRHSNTSGPHSSIPHLARAVTEIHDRPSSVSVGVSRQSSDGHPIPHLTRASHPLDEAILTPTRAISTTSAMSPRATGPYQPVNSERVQLLSDDELSDEQQGGSLKLIMISCLVLSALITGFLLFKPARRSYVKISNVEEGSLNVVKRSPSSTKPQVKLRNPQESSMRALRNPIPSSSTGAVISNRSSSDPSRPQAVEEVSTREPVDDQSATPVTSIKPQAKPQSTTSTSTRARSRSPKNQRAARASRPSKRRQRAQRPRRSQRTQRSEREQSQANVTRSDFRLLNMKIRKSRSRAQRCDAVSRVYKRIRNNTANSYYSQIKTLYENYCR